MPDDKPIFILDGSRIRTLDDFSRAFTRLFPGGHAYFRHSLDAFDDILVGGFGTPEGGFVLRWTNSEISREALGYPETIGRLKDILQTCHPSNRKIVKARIKAAERREGPTLFDELVEIIRDHGPGGDQAADGVELELA